jgi:hypothetical protein
VTTYDAEWFMDRLDVVEGRGNPPKDFFANCPVCQSVDNLHVGPRADADGNLAVHCFGCKAKQSEVIAALETGEERDAAVPKITRRRRAEAPTPEQRDPAAEADPLDWWAQHCGVPRSFLSALPLASANGVLQFQFDGMAVVKTRRAGQKGFEWVPDKAANPPLWPLPLETMPSAMLLTEGEGDATVMAFHIFRSSLDRLISVHSVTKGSSTPVPTNVWRALKARGLQDVLVLFDEDKTGDSGAKENVENAQEAGLVARRVHIEGIDLLRGEKDARDVWLRMIERDPSAEVDLNLAETTLDELGARLLVDVDGTPAPDLVHHLFDPEGHSILYGQGDAGKGVLTSKVIADLTNEGHRVLIADFEDHPAEWRRRIPAHGGAMDQVAIYTPTGALWDVADAIADIGREFGAKYLVIDSISRAIAGEKDPYSPTTPAKYATALRQIGLVTLSLAHVGRSDDLTYPFGSIGWHQQARTTNSLEDVGGGVRRLVHRKQGNRSWQGEFDVLIEFDDDAGKITTTLTPHAGAQPPSVRRTNPAAKASELVERVVAMAARMASTPSDAVTKTALAVAVGGNKSKAMAAVDQALRDGRIEVTSESRYWGDGSAVPSGSGTDENYGTEQAGDSDTTEHSVRSSSEFRSSAPREPEPEPSSTDEVD